MFMPTLLCVCLRPWFSWVGGLGCTTSPNVSQLRYESLMHGGGAERRSYQHSRLPCYTWSRARLSAACRAQLLCGQAASPGLSSPGRQAATFPWMFQSGERLLLLLVPLRMIQSGASGLFLPIYARVVLQPFILVSPRIIQSWALLGLVSASLHYHGLVRVFASLHHFGLFLLAAALLLHGLVLLAAAPLHLGLGLLFTSLHHHGLFLPMVALPVCSLVLISASLLYPGLILTAASLHNSGHIHWSVSLLHHGPVLIFAALRLLGLVHFSASLHSLGLVLCVASSLVSFAAPPWSRPPFSFASVCHFPLDAPARGVGTPSSFPG